MYRSTDVLNVADTTTGTHCKSEETCRLCAGKQTEGIHSTEVWI